MDKQVILITGASSGIGLQSATDLARAGHIVYGGARRTDPMQPLVDAGGHALQLDVNDDASMQAAVAQVIEAEGRIDVLVNNAGYATYGAVEDIPMDVGRAQLETNIIGLARMTQLVLPHMRARSAGKIINISSIGGTIHSPMGAWYHGTKWFVEGFTNSMRLEVEPLGIYMVLIAPGFIDTGFSDVLTREITRNSGQGAYKGLVENMLANMGNAPMSPPSVISHEIQQAIQARKPKTIYRAGKFSKSMYVLRRLLPHRMFDRMMLSYVK